MPTNPKVPRKKLEVRLAELEAMGQSILNKLETRALEEQVVKDKTTLESSLYIELAKTLDELDEARDGKRKYIV
jgi:hypothetical protein